MLVQAAFQVDGAIGSTYNVNGKRARQIFEKPNVVKLMRLIKFSMIQMTLLKQFYLWGYILH